MATKAERTALIFVSAVILAGGAVRLVRAAHGGLRPAPAAAAALDRQRKMTDSLARAPREKAPSPPRKARGRGRGDTTRSPLKKAEPAPAFPIDLDRATVKEIEALPRIGPALAARIVSEREANGPFLSMDAFDKRVKGIGPSMAAAIRPLVTFSGR